MAFTLNTCQSVAVDSFVTFLMNPNQSELVLSGFAGTGKTTLVKYLIDNLPKFEKAAEALGKPLNTPSEIVVTATTRKAAAVVANSLSAEALTIHSYLGLVLRNNYSTGETYLTLSKNATIKSDTLIIIDEASFMDSALLEKVRTRTRNCKILLMGDPCQLLQVNTHSSPVFDGKIPTVKLNTVMRNEGAIEKLSAQFRQSVLTQCFQPIDPVGNNVTRVSGSVFQELINDEFTSPDYKPDSSAKVLAWSNARVLEYNSYIASARGIKSRFTKGETYITNKPIMFNGKIAYSTDSVVKINSVNPHQEKGVTGFSIGIGNEEIFVPEDKNEEKAILKRLSNNKEWGEFFTIKDNWGDLRPAYASTVHKSQGSTYDKVYIDLSDIGRCNSPNDVSRLLYVAISRAAKQVILYGELPEKYTGVIHDTELSLA